MADPFRREFDALVKALKAAPPLICNCPPCIAAGLERALKGEIDTRIDDALSGLVKDLRTKLSD